MNNNKPVVLACIDDSALSEAVCDYAAWIAQRVDVPLQLLNMIDHHHEAASSSDLSGNLGVDSRDHLLEEISDQEHEQSKLRIQAGKAILQEAKQRVIADGIADPIISLQHGSLIEVLSEIENSIRVLVIGARGKIHEDQPDQIGAKLESMIRSLHRPILVAYETFEMPRSIMLAYDGSEAADKAVDMVVSSPLYQNLVCHLVYVSKNGEAGDVLDTAANKLQAVEGLEITTVCLQGRAEKMLCEYQSNEKIDMTIMGAYSHTRIHDLLLGSFTTRMLLNTNTPLLLLR